MNTEGYFYKLQKCRAMIKELEGKLSQLDRHTVEHGLVSTMLANCQARKLWLKFEMNATYGSLF